MACGSTATEPEDSVALAVTIPTVPLPPIPLPTVLLPVRFISFSNTCAVMSEAQARSAVDRLNGALGGATSVNVSGHKGIVKFAYYRYDYVPIRPQLRKDVTTIDDVQPLADAMGISRAKVAQLEQYMTGWPVEGRFLHRWLNAFRKIAMPDQVVVWQGCDGGVEQFASAFVSGVGNVVHELGHGFNLSHTFEITPTCDAYDLVYGAGGTGVPNAYFRTREECDSFVSSNSGQLIRIDVSRGGPAGSSRECSNQIVTLHHPRCSSCEVETYQTGDWQIGGYTRPLGDGTSAINALTYSNGNCSSGEFYTPSQAQIMKNYWTQSVPWVFDQGRPVAVEAPVDACTWLDSEKGLHVGESFYSCNGRYSLTLQRDSNLVIRDGDRAIWATGLLGSTDSAGADTTGTDTSDMALLMSGTGNLGVYDNHGRAVFATGTTGYQGAYLKLTDQGGLEVRYSGGLIWRRSNPAFHDPTCSTGIAAGAVCCAASCGSCGGAGCDRRPGGSAACCGGPITNAGVSCSGSGPPCVVD